MSKIIDAAKVQLKNSRVFLDTNVWILINGFSANAAQAKIDLYSQAYKALLDNDNTIVLNDYVVGEFFNRCAKIEYDIRKTQAAESGAKLAHFKTYRSTSDFADFLEGLRDTCLNMIDDCEFVAVDGGHYDIADIVRNCVAECIDFSDSMIMSFCRKEGLCVMTDDADYEHCGLEIISGNRKLVGTRKPI